MTAILRALKLLLGLVSPWQRVKIVLVLLGSSATEGLGVVLLLPLLELVGIAGDTASGPSATIARMFASVGLTPSLPAVLALFVASAVGRAWFSRWQALLAADLEQQVTDGLRLRLLRALALANWEMYTQRRSSSLLLTIAQTVGLVGGTVYNMLELAVAALVAVAYFLVAFWMSPAITLVVAGLAAVLGLGMRRQLRRVHGRSEAVLDSSAVVYHALAEHLTHLRTVRAFGAEARSIDAFARESARHALLVAASNRETAAMRTAMTVGPAVAMAAIVLVAVNALRIAPASLLLLLFACGRLLPRVTSLYERLQVVAQQLPGVSSIFDLEAECLATAPSAAAARALPPLTREVALTGVSFTYAGADAPTLDDVSVRIGARTFAAVLGPSGSGKSTLADLLLGLLTPTTGTVAIDGTALAPEAAQSWRAQLGYVPQDATLFNDTLRNNLLWAKPDAADVEMWEALRAADAESFVRALPEGLDTVVRDRGIRFSGGERQRLALARALLRRPALLVLDEATSALDAVSRARIDDVIARLREHTTVLLITHRVESAKNADQIVVLEAGRIVQSGRWDDLLAQPGSRLQTLLAAEGVED